MFKVKLTVVTLSDTVLDASPLGQVSDFGPVFMGMGAGRKGRAGGLVAGCQRGRTAVGKVMGETGTVHGAEHWELVKVMGAILRSEG
jgi:hypothetical protein